MRLYDVVYTWCVILITCQSPLSTAMCVAAVKEDVGVMTWPIGRVGLHEYAKLGLQGFQTQSAGGVIATVGLNHVMREETLNVVQHPRRAHVKLLHVRRGQQGGLTVWAESVRVKGNQTTVPDMGGWGFIVPVLGAIGNNLIYKGMLIKYTHYRTIF